MALVEQCVGGQRITHVQGANDGWRNRWHHLWGQRQVAARHMGEAYSDALADHPLTLETVAVIPYCEPDSGTAIKVRSQDRAVDSLPGFAVSLMIVRR